MSDAASDSNIVEILRTCRSCGIAKPFSAYTKRKNGPGGYLPTCKECTYAYQSNWRKSNRDKHRAMQKRAEAKERAKNNAGRIAQGKPPFGQKDVGDTRWCATCRIYKPKAEFHKQGSGLHAHCRPCSIELARQWANKNKEKRREHQRASGLRKYGLTVSAFDALYSAQGGACAICREHLKRKWERGVAVDHDHATGIVRGILCYRCNIGLGGMRDNVAFLLSAIAYLKRSRGDT